MPSILFYKDTLKAPFSPAPRAVMNEHLADKGTTDETFSSRITDKSQEENVRRS